MPDSNRRKFLKICSCGIVTTLAGCTVTRNGTPEETDRQTANTPAYDCATASRPEPDPSTSSDVNRRSYPDVPTSLTASSAADFVREYERAYRRNALLVEYGSALENQSTSIYDSRRFDSPAGAHIIRLHTKYSFTASETPSDDGETAAPVAGDSPETYVTYYVDSSVVMRTEAVRYNIDTSELQPDPYDSGVVLECF